MLAASDTKPALQRAFDVRVLLAIPLLAAAAIFTWLTIQGLEARRLVRTELAEISHVRYGLLNANIWVAKLVPILDRNIDALNLTPSNGTSLRPMVENALYHLLDDVKAKMSAPAPQQQQQQPASGGGMGALLGQGNALIANMMINSLRPHVPEYASVVLKELGKPQTRDAVKKYIRGVLTEGAKNTFGEVDMRWYNSILQKYGCANAGACRDELGRRVQQADEDNLRRGITVLSACALAFVFLMTSRARRTAILLMMLFCVVLLLGGILTPMIEVEARITDMKMTFLGSPIEFSNQSLYYQSKSVLEVFRTLITMDRPDMWIVGVLVLMFSVVFPILKLSASTFALWKPGILRNQVVRFFALESSKWSMADVMALAIFMAFVAFNGLIPNALSGLRESGAQIAIPTDSSRILPGYHLFIGFCIASLFLSRKVSRDLAASVK